MTIYRYRCKSRVAKIEKRTRREHISGLGDKAVTRDVPTGWWATTEGPSPITFQVGSDEPEFGAGDLVHIILEVET